jgi:hypothetical protein
MIAKDITLSMDADVEEYRMKPGFFMVTLSYDEKLERGGGENIEAMHNLRHVIGILHLASKYAPWCLYRIEIISSSSSDSKV